MNRLSWYSMAKGLKMEASNKVSLRNTTGSNSTKGGYEHFRV